MVDINKKRIQVINKVLARIQQYGKKYTYKKIRIVANESEPWKQTYTSSDILIDGLFTRAKKSSFGKDHQKKDHDKITSDFKCYITSPIDENEFTPKIGDKVVKGMTEYKVIKFDLLELGGKVVVYIMYVKA